MSGALLAAIRLKITVLRTIFDEDIVLKKSALELKEVFPAEQNYANERVL